MGDDVPRRERSGLLLSGGSSSRMGQDKTQLLVEGVTLAQRTARLLTRVVDVALEVGPGTSGLPSILDDPPGDGPLSAIVIGHLALRHREAPEVVLIVASDLPNLTEELLTFLVTFDAPGSVVPIVEGRAQPLCARWSRRDLDTAVIKLREGDRSLRFLPTQPEVTLLEEHDWHHVASADTFADVDTPDEARRWGLLV